MLKAIFNPKNGEIVCLMLPEDGSGDADKYLGVCEHEDQDKEDILRAMLLAGDPHPSWDYPYRDTSTEEETVGVIDKTVDLDGFDDDYLTRLNRLGDKVEMKMRKDVRIVDKDRNVEHEGKDAKKIRDKRIEDDTLGDKRKDALDRKAKETVKGKRI